MLPNPLWAPLKNIIVYNRRKIYIDNLVFRLHYTWTVMLFFACSILVTSKIYIGDPINCMSSPDIKAIADQYCFIHSTYTRGVVENGRWTYRPVKENEIHPGVHPAMKGEEIVYHSYYQWVWIVLMIQSVFFFYPHWIWEKIEGGTVRMLVGDLNLPMLGDEKKRKQRGKICDYFSVQLGYHNRYAFWHFFCEIVNLVNICAQTYATDYFLNFEFSQYGFHLFLLTQMRPYLRHDALARVFPTVTSCRLATGGVAFGKNQHDILCILPINILNEKIYIFIWYWFLVVSVASTLGVVYRILTLVCPAYRKFLLGRRARFVTNESLNKCCVDIKYGDWFLIYKLSQNINPVAFSDLIADLVESFNAAGSSVSGVPRRKRSTMELKPKHAPSPNAPPESPLLVVEQFMDSVDGEQDTPFSTP